MDKVAHFGVGGLITAAVAIVAMLQDIDILLCETWRALLYPIIGTVVTVFVSVIKELLIDGSSDWKDLYAALYGSGIVFVASFVGWLLHVCCM